MNSTIGDFLGLNSKVAWLSECFFVHNKNFFKVFCFSLSLKEQMICLKTKENFLYYFILYYTTVFISNKSQVPYRKLINL